MWVCVEQRTVTQARKILERLFQVRLVSVHMLLPVRNNSWGYLSCFCLCVQLAAAYFRTLKCNVWRWTLVAMLSLQQKVPFWGCFNMTNTKPRRRIK